MGDLVGIGHGSGEVERGEVVEVVTLGKTLTSLFKGLGITQAAYGVRVGLGNSAVSRYLSGTRMPTRTFVDQLVVEVEKERESPLLVSAKETVRHQYLAALKATNAREFELEMLRDELEAAKREVKRSQRSVESLHLLLERREQEARCLQADLEQMQLDWGRERGADAREVTQLEAQRHAYSSASEELLRQVEELRADLAGAEVRRAAAESRSRALRDDVMRLEQRLAEQAAGRAEREMTLDAFKAHLVQLWQRRRAVETERDLAEAAWSRPYSEVVELIDWLDREQRGEDLYRFVSDVARFRDFEEALCVADSMAGRAAIIRSLSSSIAKRITPENVSLVSRRWVNIDLPAAGRLSAPGVENAPLLDEVIADFVHHQDMLRRYRIIGQVLAEIPQDARASVYFYRTAEALARSMVRLPTRKGGLEPVLALIRDGWEELARQLLGAELARPGREQVLLDLLRHLGADNLDRLFVFCGMPHEPFMAPRYKHVPSIAQLLTKRLVSAALMGDERLSASTGTAHSLLQHFLDRVDGENRTQLMEMARHLPLAES